jgi:hypothetical protein
LSATDAAAFFQPEVGAADAPFELALTLRAMAETGADDGGEAAAILERLGVVSTQTVPLP